MKKLFLASLMGMLIGNLAFADTSIKSQIGTQDLNMDTDGSAHGTFQRRTSTGGTITLDKIDGNRIPWSTDYTRTIRPKNITGNGTGNISGYDNGTFTGTVSAPKIGSASYTDNGYFNDLIAKGPWVDVRSMTGFGYNTSYIKIAADLLDNTIGGEIYIPKGTYKGSAVLEFLGKNNLTLRGDGKGKTILDFSDQADLTTTIVGKSFAPLTFDTAGAGHGSLKNITIRDLTIKSSTVAPSVNTQKSNIYFGAIEGMNVINVELDGGYYEGLYTESSPSKVRVENCDIKNNSSSYATGAIDFNTLNGKDILISGNTFDNLYIAIAALGEGVLIENNVFRNIVRLGIEYGESNGMTSRSLSGATINNNVFIDMGRGATASGSGGIGLATTGKLYNDNTMDVGNIVSGNVFVNAYTDYSFVAIRTNGSVKVSNNYAVGLRNGSNLFNEFFFYDGTGEGTTKIFLDGNVVQSTLATKNYDYGVVIAKTDNVTVQMSGNNITATTALLTNNGTFGSAAYNPWISLNGDILNGYINIGLSETLNADNAINNIPLYGNTTGMIRTDVSKGLLHKNLDNTTTPSVKGASHFRTAAATTVTITNFTNGIRGQEITVICYDNTATIANGTRIKLSGGSNFSCTPYDTIRLMRLDFGSTEEWVEIGRSVN